MRKGFLFDMDGTLINSMGVWDGFAEEYLQSYGLEPSEGLNDILKVQALNTSAQYVAEHYLPQKTPDEILREWEEVMCQRYDRQTSLKPGVLEFLEKNRDRKMAILTSNGRRILDHIVEKYGLKPYMEWILTAADLGLEKTDPGIFEAAAQKLHLHAEDCVVFEDSLHAIESAKNAGCYVVGFSEPLFAQDAKKVEETADRYVSDFSQLLQLNWNEL
ncbi:MAG: HAD family hydrolase [Eubacteriales bacterium]|jgi:HAD superfamily hydrolase (TIGR01509 family)